MRRSLVFTPFNWRFCTLYSTRYLNVQSVVDCVAGLRKLVLTGTRMRKELVLFCMWIWETPEILMDTGTNPITIILIRGEEMTIKIVLCCRHRHNSCRARLSKQLSWCKETINLLHSAVMSQFTIKLSTSPAGYKSSFLIFSIPWTF